MIRNRALKGFCILALLLFAGTTVSCQEGRKAPLSIGPGVSAAGDVKVLVAYRSKYGSTRQYAEWIREESRGDLIDLEAGPGPELAGYDVVIIGGYVRTGSIVVAPFIRERWLEMERKEIVLFTTSGTPPGHPKLKSIYEKGLPEAIRTRIAYFPLPGRLAGRDLTAFDRMLIALGKVMEKDETLKRDMGKDFDGVRREHLTPLLEHLEKIKANLRRAGGR
jgi:menaquinone-dependent protoporphyrinogen IX oxidase